MNRAGRLTRTATPAPRQDLEEHAEHPAAGSVLAWPAGNAAAARDLGGEREAEPAGPPERGAGHPGPGGAEGPGPTERGAGDPRLAEHGEPLDPAVRGWAERAFGTDLSAVVVHTGPAAEQAAHAVRASAYTIGDHVVLGTAGAGRLAHELAHVVQQRLGGPAPVPEQGAPSEQGARRAAHAALAGQTGVGVGPGTAPGLARAPEDEEPEEEEQEEPEEESEVQAAQPAGKAKPLIYAGMGPKGGLRTRTRPLPVPEVVKVTGMLPRPGTAPALDEQERSWVAEAEALAERLGRGTKKTKATTTAGTVQRSGFGQRGGGGGGGAAVATQKVMDVAKDIGHPLAANASLDEGIPGQEKASHAEKLAAIEDPNAPIAVDRRMCDDCFAFFQQLAHKRGVPLVVREPGRTWVFRTDKVAIGRDANSDVVLHPDGRVSAGDRRDTFGKPPGGAGPGGAGPGGAGPGGAGPGGTGPGGAGPGGKAKPAAANQASGAAPVPPTTTQPPAKTAAPAKAAPAKAEPSKTAALAEETPAETTQATAAQATPAQASAAPASAAPAKIAAPARVEPTGDERIKRGLDSQVRAARDEAATTQATLAELEATERETGLTAAQTARRDALRTRAAALERTISRADADLRLLTEPGATDASLNELRARRGYAGSVAATTQQQSTGPRLTEKGVVSRDEEVASRLDQGTSRTVTDARTKTLTSSSYTDERQLTAKVTTGDLTTSTSITTARSLQAAEGNLTGTSARTTKTESVDEGTGEQVSTSRTAARSVGTGGLSSSTETSSRTGGQLASTSASTGLVRGGGQVGVQSSSGTTTGQVDSEGALVKGTSTRSTASGGILAGPGQAGLGGKVGREQTQTHAKGVTTGQSTTLDGKVLVTCQEVEGSSPPRYRVGLTISLGGGLTVSAGAEKKALAEAAGGTAGLSVTASGSLTASFSQLMSEEETAAYLGAVRDHKANGAYRELQVIELAAHGAMEEAGTLLSQISAVTGSAAAAKQLREGQAVEVKAAGSGGATASAGGTSGGGASLGVKLGYSRSGSLGRTVSREGGKIIVRVEVIDESSGTAGLSGGFGVGSGGMAHTEGTLTGQSVTFQLDPDKDPRFDARFAQIDGADSVQKLRALGAANPDLVTSSTITTGTSSSTSTSAAIAKVGLDIEESTSLTEAVTTDKTGVSKQITGTASLGGGLSLPVGPKITSKTTDTFSGKVGPANTATGEASTTTSTTDLGRSAAALAEAPIATVTGAVTGSGSLLQQRTEARGTKVDDTDYQRLMQLSASAHTWDNVFTSSGGRVNDALEDWRRTRGRIQAAGDDREAVIRALAEYETGGSGRGPTVQAAFKTAGGGIRFDFPDVLSAQKPAYEELVVGDPAAAARVLTGAGKTAEAVDKLGGDLRRLAELQRAIQAKESEVTDSAVLAEMLRRIGDRAAELRAEVRTLRQPAPAVSAPAAGGSAGRTAALDPAAAAAQQAAQMEERNARIAEDVSACQVYQSRENRIFGLIDEEYSHWYRKADTYFVVDRLNELKAMYEEWDRKVARLRAVFVERGEPASKADQYAPNRAAWEQKYQRWAVI